MSEYTAFPKQEQFGGHAMAETRDMWPNDIRLRAFGFKVVARPLRGPALWSYDGRLYTEAQALEAARLREEKGKVVVTGPVQ